MLWKTYQMFTLIMLFQNTLLTREIVDDQRVSKIVSYSTLMFCNIYTLAQSTQLSGLDGILLKLSIAALCSLLVATTYYYIKIILYF